ncbi:hypothetical protein [Nodosilinea sp. P-1105]|uniref:hypothetical protein n=1 Tax=Nodosilinea sp. P-1105 TaxID=2546229 RepID=UPI001469AF32|nr:hypothetical protein [Nodosilinea sp. P-1105]NMF84449.1 hypothetical protein [Nodosilinea sp. P-1105]
MALNSSLEIVSPQIGPLSPHAIECKLLLDRGLYTPCHIWVPDIDHRLPAIYVDNQFYSFFKTTTQASKALDVMARLGRRDDYVALTQTVRGYAVWAHEPGARYAPPDRNPGYRVYPVFGPKPCLLLTHPSAYQLQRLRVPDMANPIDGLLYQGQGYSIFKQGQTVDKLLTTAAKLAQRGDHPLIAFTASTCLLAVLEPGSEVV